MTTPAQRAGRSVVAVVPHPDDETYAMGGLLALCADQGATVRVLSLTRGERGTPRDPNLPGSDDLGQLREQELRASCRILGCSDVTILGVSDGGVDAERAEFFDGFCRILDRWAPDLVVTLGRDGVYGHRDHLTCTHWVQEWWERNEHRSSIRVLHSAFPTGLFAGLRRRLLRYTDTRTLIADTDSSLGCGEDEVDLVLDIRATRDRKLASVSAHRSQLLDGDPSSFLGPGVLSQLSDREWYTVAVGPPLGRGSQNPWEGM